MSMTDKRIICLMSFKSRKTSGNKYLITLEYKDKIIKFHYHDNYLNKSTLTDFIHALKLDAESYKYNSNHLEFAKSFGYEDIEEAKKIYDACEKQFIRYNKLFSKEEQEEINKLLVNYWNELHKSQSQIFEILRFKQKMLHIKKGANK